MEASIRRSEVLRYLGHTNQQIDADLDARIEGAIELAQSRLRPRSVWMTFDLAQVRCDADGFETHVLGTPLALEGQTARRYLEGARRAAVMACTLGVESERMLLSLEARDPLGALAFDAACTDYVEAGADGVQAEVEALAHSEGLTLGIRFSPGYGDLKLEIQPLILKTLDASRRLGLFSNEAHMLVPSKSVTAFVGLFEPGAMHEPALGCRDCPLRDSCTMRERGTPCSGGAMP